MKKICEMDVVVTSQVPPGQTFVFENGKALMMISDNRFYTRIARLIFRLKWWLLLKWLTFRRHLVMFK